MHATIVEFQCCGLLHTSFWEPSYVRSTHDHMDAWPLDDLFHAGSSKLHKVTKG